MEKSELSDTAGGNVKWSAHHGKESGSTSNDQTVHHMTQSLHSQIHAKEKLKHASTQELIHQC
jgi:hypothetical protein